MKTSTFLVATTFALALQCTAFAADGASLSFIKTNSGKVYTNCRVFKTDPDGVIIAHQHGGAKLLFADLPEESRRALGYDAEKAEAYEKERAEKKAKDREELWKYRREVAKAQAAAYTAEAMRQEFISVQNIASVGGYGWDGLYGFGYTPGYGHGYAGHRGRQPFWNHDARRRMYPTQGDNGGGFRVRSGHFHGGTPQKAVPLATPAMGPLTPALGAGR